MDFNQKNPIDGVGWMFCAFANRWRWFNLITNLRRIATLLPSWWWRRRRRRRRMGLCVPESGRWWNVGWNWLWGRPSNCWTAGSTVAAKNETETKKNKKTKDGWVNRAISLKSKWIRWFCWRIFPWNRLKTGKKVESAILNFVLWRQWRHKLI